MDREQEEMQFLGLFGIYFDSYKLVIRWRKIFSQITLSLILPLSFIYLAHMELSHLLFSRIYRTETQLEHIRPDSPRHRRLSDHVTTEFITLLLFKIAYFTFFLIFSLLSTSAVVYTVACVYTARDVSFGKVMSVVPKVWKRLMVTFLCAFAAFFVYNFVAAILVVLWIVFTLGATGIADAGLVIFLVLYVVGFAYVSVLWQLASVVSVLEESYGFRAMAKSVELIKGKLTVAMVIFIKINLSQAATQILFQRLVVRGYGLDMSGRVGIGLLCLLLMLKIFLFGLVIQTIIYFVCKSYHHESIDKSALSDHLEVYLGEYVPLKSKDVQLEQYSDRV